MTADENNNSSDQISNEVLVMMDRVYSTYLAKSNSTALNTTSLAVDIDGAAASDQAIQLIPQPSLLVRARNMFSWNFMADYVYAHFETIYAVIKLINQIKARYVYIHPVSSNILVRVHVCIGHGFCGVAGEGQCSLDSLNGHLSFVLRHHLFLTVCRFYTECGMLKQNCHCFLISLYWYYKKYLSIF